ncbi:MAG: amidohydrolase family protein [Chitinispirillaceae bacterium]|nr:amidohydrolase family protein [Chitinispirillaceae bacterium]
MAEKPVIKHIYPGDIMTGSTGKKITFHLHLPRPRFLLDGHSHIQSGACAPLPLIWAQNPITDKLHFRRPFLNLVAPLFTGSGGRIQKLTTEKIGAKLAGEIGRTVAPDSPLRNSGDDDFFAASFIMLMDMDYAHIAGFKGSPVYHEDGRKVVYYPREDAHAEETAVRPDVLSHERPNMVWVYQHYIKQYRSTKNAVLKNPWKLIPMFHYDPRRWRNPAGGKMDKENWNFGPWDFPFEHIATAKKTGIFIGFKMYPPLGYKPLDHRLPYIEQFYKQCAERKIPLLTHCSPGGMTTHEDRFYYQLDGVNLETYGKNNAHFILGYNPATPEGYFQDAYVHPKNWRPALELNNGLKLCLAHLGGNEWTAVGIESDWIQEIVRLTKEFPNVYTDVSCYNLEDDAMRNNIEVLLEQVRDNPDYHHLQDKLIFGVDWYLSMITGAPEYREYVELFFRLIKEIDEEQWWRSTVVNPARFYGLDNPDIIENMYSAMEDNKADREKREHGYEKVKKISEYINTL